MPTPVTHGVVAIVLARLLTVRKGLLFPLLCIGVSIFPDIDKVVSKLLGETWFGAPLFANRGFTHGLLFAFVTAAVAAGLVLTLGRAARPWWLLYAWFLTVSLSHGALDAFSHGSVGVAFFAPFSDGRYLAPVTPLPTTSYREFFSESGWVSFGREVLWVWLPAGCVFAAATLVRRKRSAAPPNGGR